MKSQLHMALPRLAALEGGARVGYRQLDRQGRTEAEGEAAQAQLKSLARGREVLAWLHPDDSLCTELVLPPLPAARLGAAVQCAAQGLILGDVRAVHIAHGPRAADGKVAVAWLGQAALQGLAQWLSNAGLKPRGLYPTPARAGACPVASLHSGLRAPGAAQHGWPRALALCASAAMIWTLGLNLYAARLADTGQQLRQHMHQQVRAAYPQLQVILNPLQQVRQQLAAGDNGAVAPFNHLLQAAGSAMPFLAGAVEQLTYHDGVLDLQPLPGAARPPADNAWQTQLAAQGIEASSSDHGWTLRPATATGEEVANVE